MLHKGSGVWTALSEIIAVHKAIEESRSVMLCDVKISDGFDDFYNIFIWPDFSDAHKESIVLLIDKILKINNNVCSVDAKCKSHLKENLNRYDLLETIPLKDHLLRSAIFALEIAKQEQLKRSIAGMSVIIALGHDIAKCQKTVKDIYAKSGEWRHDQMSAIWLKMHLGAYLSAEELEAIYKTIYHHHDRPRQYSSFYADLLIKADTAAREEEIRIATEKIYAK